MTTCILCAISLLVGLGIGFAAGQREGDRERVIETLKAENERLDTELSSVGDDYDLLGGPDD